jgi:hypothetical protein
MNKFGHPTVTLQLFAIEQALVCLKGETPYGLINRELAK